MTLEACRSVSVKCIWEIPDHRVLKSCCLERRMTMTRTSVRRTANVLVGTIAAMLLVSILGCATTHTRPFDSDWLPRDKYFVGVGIMINWTAPQDGTAYVVMSAAGERKIIQTQHMTEAGEFDLEMSGADQETIDQIEKMLGAKLSETEFSLYFVPSPKDKSAQ